MSALRDLILDALKQADHLLLALCCAANLYGIVLIYSATRYKAALHSMAFKQGISMVIGIVLYFAVSQFNIDVFRTHWKQVIAGCTVLVLLLRTPLGKSVSGNRAWLQIPHLSAFTIQPAEINKIFFAILLAHLIVYLKRQRKLNKLKSVVTMGALLGYFVGLYYVISGDMGSCLIFFAIFIVMLWTGGVSPLWFAAGIGAVVPAVMFIWPRIPADNYQKKRILVLFDHTLDPQGTGFQQEHGILAVRSGGLLGQGFMKGVLTQSAQNNRLSQRFSDFIFASCCEEWGLLGAAVVILLLTAIILRIMYVGLRCNDPFAMLVCMGFAGMFMAQVGINIGMCLYVMPVIGLTLPFFSAGGTSVMVNFLIMGIVSGIRNRSEPEWLKNTETPEPPPPQENQQPRRKSVLFTPGDRTRSHRTGSIRRRR